MNRISPPLFEVPEVNKAQLRFPPNADVYHIPRLHVNFSRFAPVNASLSKEIIWPILFVERIDSDDIADRLILL
jgi:hypothetical protein